MPYKPKQICRYVGCNELTYDSYCSKHKPKDVYRPNAYRRGYGYKWQKARQQYLLSHPLCVECKRNGKYIQAKVVDHIIPHKGNQELFWDENNWQPLCTSCHNRKTAVYDGAWGKAVKKYFV